MNESINASANGSPQPVLFDRLGGRPGLEALLVDFYQQAQQDPVIGPVFQKHVHDWPSHIATVTDFWSTQTGGPLVYRGGMGRHLRLGLEPQHFEHWLALWQRVTRQRVDAESADQLLEIGRLVAGRLIDMAAGMHGVRITARPA
jgi:hemoglobin